MNKHKFTKIKNAREESRKAKEKKENEKSFFVNIMPECIEERANYGANIDFPGVSVVRSF